MELLHGLKGPAARREALWGFVRLSTEVGSGPGYRYLWLDLFESNWTYNPLKRFPEPSGRIPWVAIGSIE